MNKSQYEQHESQIKSIFTPENLIAIQVLIGALRPRYGNFVKEDAHATVVNAAKVDAIDELLYDITKFVATKSLPVTVQTNEKD